MIRVRLLLLALIVVGALAVLWRSTNAVPMWRSRLPAALDLNDNDGFVQDAEHHDGHGGNFWEPYVLGPPTASLFGTSCYMFPLPLLKIRTRRAENLRNDTKYITSWPAAGMSKRWWFMIR
jgi:hypothetical protein